MLQVGDKVQVIHGKFKGCVGEIVSINYDCIPPITIRPDDRNKYQGVYFYPCDLKKFEKHLTNNQQYDIIQTMKERKRGKENDYVGLYRW